MKNEKVMTNENKSLISALKITLELLEKEEQKNEVKEKEVFTERQMNFPKDDDVALFNKYKNKKYLSFNDDIFSLINKRYDKIKLNRIKLEEKYLLYEKFFNDINELEKKEKKVS